MSDYNSGELLSAYYDGETSHEDFAIVERLLETSAEARRELDEIGELSQMLNSLPRQTAPVELSSSILNRAERESLLPAFAASTVSAKSSPRSPSRLRLVTGLLAVAAALLLVVFLVTRQSPDQSDSTQVVQHGKLEEADESVEGSAAIETADQSATNGKLVESTDSTLTLSATESKAGIRSFSNSAFNESQLRDVQIGDVIPYFAVAQNQVAVLEVTVIDVQKAVGITQLLLEGNQIPQIFETPSKRITQSSLKAEKALKPSVQTQTTTGGLFAVYIESSESQLAETMEQLRLEGILADMKLRPPVELSQVKLADGDSVANTNMRSQQEQEQTFGTLADAVTRGRSQRVKRSPKIKSINDNKDAIPKREEKFSKTTKRDLKSTTGDRPRETGNAFQMLINVLPRSLTEKTSGKPGKTKQQAAEAVKKFKPALRTSSLRTNSVAEPPLPDETESARIRVILIFQGQPPVEAPKPE